MLFAESFPPANVFHGGYRYIRDLQQLQACQSSGASPTWVRGPSPVASEILASYLSCHPDRAFAAFILRGLTEGFRIGFDSSRCHLRSVLRNHPSSLSNGAVVESYMATELELGRLLGPVPRAGVHSSPIGLIPKARQPNRWRMIVDLSCPTGQSVNDGIAPGLCSIQYASIDEAVRIILSMGVGTNLVKIDLKEAYRMVPVHPADHHLLGITWGDATYVDRCLPFGLRSAPKLFSAVADALAWAFRCLGVYSQVHYLDDFLFFGRPDSDEASAVLSVVMRACEDLGVPVAMHKTEGPASSLTFLGIIIDTVRLELRLPQEKLERLQELVAVWIHWKFCVRKELESFIGHLSHAATVVQQGRTFLHELFRLLAAARSPHHHVKLSPGAKADILWWACFLRTWNGRSFFPRLAPSVHVYSDAAGSVGCGAFQVGGSWFMFSWPQAWSGASIAVLELVPIVVAAAVWGWQWQGQGVCFHSDNEGVVSVVNKGSSSDSSLSHLMRCLSFFAAFFRFNFSALHIPGVLNEAADALSRGNTHLFHSLIPQVGVESPVPAQLRELLVTKRPDWGSADWTRLFRGCLATVLLHQQRQHMHQDGDAI